MTPDDATRAARALVVVVVLVALVAGVVAGTRAWSNADRKSDRTVHELCTYSTPEGVLDLCK